MAWNGVLGQIGAFERAFTPVEGGYLYYPSAKSGGKLITQQEHDELVANWRRVAGFVGSQKTVGIAFGCIFVWVIISVWLDFPDWTSWIAILGAIVFIFMRIMPVAFAPRRLVRDRPAIALPRPLTQSRRQARASLSWRMVIFVLVFSGLAFAGSLSTPTYTMSWWVWTTITGALFAAYIWIAYLKVRDRYSQSS